MGWKAEYTWSSLAKEETVTKQIESEQNTNTSPSFNTWFRSPGPMQKVKHWLFEVYMVKQIEVT
jgi:hypothetical protein